MGYKYKAWSIGKNSQAAKTEIEKLTDSLNDFTLQQLLDESIRILLTVRDEKQKNLMIEAGWVGDTSKGLFKVSYLYYVENNFRILRLSIEIVLGYLKTWRNSGSKLRKMPKTY